MYHKRERMVKPTIRLDAILPNACNYDRAVVSSYCMNAKRKITLADLAARKRNSRKFSVLTCYDYTTAMLMSEAGVDVLLVGDTYAEVCLGHATTLPLKLDHLLIVTEAVRRGAPDVVLMGDMPYMSYQPSIADAIRNAGRFMAEAGCDCVKVEVDGQHFRTVEAMAAASIPVVAHLGLRPQNIHLHGGYKAQAKTAADAKRLIDDALMMEQAGAVMLLLEAVTTEVAKMITERVSIPVIGCVAGPYCDGTVVVMHDMLGYAAGHPPQSVKRYAQLRETLIDAFRAYAEDVTSGRFPSTENGIAMKSEELERLIASVGQRPDKNAVAPLG